MPRPLLTEAQALEQYRLLLEGYEADNSLLDKASNIRSRIDTILRMAYVSKFPGLEVSIKKINMETIINALLPGPLHENLKNRLHKARKALNEKAMHRYELETLGGTEFRETDYRDCLSAICEIVALMSGQPIPLKLNQALKRLYPRTVRVGARLEAIFLIQLFSGLGHIQDGAYLISQFNQMLAEKKRLELHGFHVHLVTYSPAITIHSPIDSRTDKERLLPADGTTREALGHALDCLDSAILRHQERGGEKPWLVWIATDLTDRPDDLQVQHLQQLMDNKEVGFYPMASNQQVKDDFLHLWPDCGPYSFNPRHASNYFKSVLTTIQQRFYEIEDFIN